MMTPDALLPRRVLQSRLEPLPGQSLPSYLDMLAASLPYPVPLVTALFRTGLIDEEKVSAVGYGYGITLKEERLRAFARLTRLDEARVRDMLLTRYDGVALELSGLTVLTGKTVRDVARGSWCFFGSSWICPLCIAEAPALQVSWRLPIHFACLRHRVLHTDTCPQCGKLLGWVRDSHGGSLSFASQVPQPGRCWNAPPVGHNRRGITAKPCGFDLSLIPAHDLSMYPRLLDTQRTILEVLEHRAGRVAGQEVPALDYVGHLRSMTALLLYCMRVEDLGELPPALQEAASAHVAKRNAKLDERDERRRQQDRGGPIIKAYRGVPRSAALMAAVLPTAVEVLAAGSMDKLAARLTPVLERTREVKLQQNRMVGVYFKFTGLLAVALDVARSHPAQFDLDVGLHSRHVPAGGYRFRAAHVPQLLWADVYRSHFEVLLRGSDIGQDYARRAISMALVKLTGKYTWVKAAQALDLPSRRSAGIAAKFIGVINASGHAEAFTNALHDVAGLLHNREHPFDYAAIRQQLRTFREVPWETWRGLVCRAGRLPGRRGIQNCHAAAYVWSWATQGDWRLSPAQLLRSSRSARELYVRFQNDELPFVHKVLEEFAVDLLAGRSTPVLTAS